MFKMMNKSENMAISIMEFINEKNFKVPIHISELINYLYKLGFEFDKESQDFESIVKNFFTIDSNYILSIKPTSILDSSIDRRYLFIHTQGLKTALDYIQLKEARESSKVSLDRSTLAIWISIVLAVIPLICNSCATTQIKFDDNTRQIFSPLQTLKEKKYTVELSEDSREFIKEQFDKFNKLQNLKK